MNETVGLRRTPLYERHLALGARMVAFGGWEMPVQYSGIIEEHRAVREAAGLFDISHMGEVEVHGPDALPFLQYLVTYDVAAIQPGHASYALMCRPDGGIIDDTFIYNLGNYYLIVVNAANIAKDVAWMHKCAKNFDVTVSDVSDHTGMLALQGPLAEALLTQFADADIAALPFHGVVQGRVLHTPAIVARTGYTGEDGFEIFVAAGEVTWLWDELLDAGRSIGLKPCGLGARDSLRFEACLALYGHEITEETNPYEARLGWVVKLDKGDFIGREALQHIKQEGVAQRLTGFEMVGRGIARSEYEIRNLEGATIGRVTSGMPSPTLGKNLGMGYVPVALSTEGSEFDVVVRDRPVRARAVRMPFYRPRYKKS